MRKMVELTLIIAHSLRQQRWRFRVHKAREAQQEGCDQGFENRTDGRCSRIYHKRGLAHAKRKSTEARLCSQGGCCAKNGAEKTQRKATKQPGGECCPKDWTSQTNIPRNSIAFSEKAFACASQREP